MLNNTIKLTNKNDYLTNQYQIDKTDKLNRKTISTGIKSLDEKLTIRSGVYLIGGLPSIGKTSLALQLADTFAEQGHHILFFSLEQAEYDSTTKSINRIMFSDLLSEKEAIKKYSSFADKINTATSTSAMMVEDLVDTVKDFINTAQSKPIVFIDYLQLLHTRKYLSKRESIEEVSQQLVSLSKQYELTLFVISSLNRANYLSPIDFESFKESGLLEYDASVVLGLQYQLLSDPTFVNMSSADKKRLLISKEKIKESRSVELSCLKNRFGPIFESCKLNYLPKADLFAEYTQNERESKKSIKVL